MTAKHGQSKLEPWTGNVRTPTVSRVVCGMQSCPDRMHFKRRPWLDHAFRLIRRRMGLLKQFKETEIV